MAKKFGDEVIKVVGGKVIEEAYRLMDLNYWKKLLKEGQLI